MIEHLGEYLARSLNGRAAATPASTTAARRGQPHPRHTTRMPHRASHSRRLARQAEAQHALGPLFETLHSPSDTADGHSLQPAHTAPPPPSSVGLLEQLSERQRAEQQATTSARTAAQPHPPPESPPAAPPASAGHPAGGMHGDAAQSNRIEAAFQALQLLESVSTDIIREEYVMDVLSRLSLLQHNIHLQLQRGNMRRNAPDFV